MLLLRAHRPDAAEAQGHLAADHRHGHARHRHPAAPPHQRHGRLRRGVLHRRRSCRARTWSASSTAAGRITQGSLAHERAGLWVEGVGAARADRRRARRARAAARAATDDPVVRRKIAEFYELASSLRALGYKGFASFAQGSSAPEHCYMKMATSEAGKAAYELGMEIIGPARRRSPTRARPTIGRWSHGFFMSFANTIAGGSSEIQRNIIAQRVLGLPEELTPMDFSLTDDQTAPARHRAQAARPRVPARAGARAHRRSRACTTAVAPPARVHRARRRARDRPVPVPRARPATPPRPDRSSRPRCYAVARPATTTTHRAPSRCVDDPVNPFVLEADRVERDRDRRPRPDARRRRHADGPRPAALRRDASTSRAACSSSTPIGARRRRATARADAYARWRDRALRVARGRDGRHRAPDLRHDARVREGARAVRRADRLVPGDPAQARRHVARARAGDRGGALRGDDRRRRRRPTAPAPATSPRPRPARPPAGSSRTASRSTAASATRGSTTCTSTCGGPPPTSTCSAPPAGTSTASPTC